MRGRLLLTLAALGAAILFGAIGAFMVLLVNARAEAQIWVPALFALFGAVVAPYIAEWLRAHWFIAEFQLDARDETPWYIATRSELPGAGAVDQVFEAVMHFYRISVRNAGLSQAQNCEAVLEALWFQHADSWWKLEYWEPDNLHWAGDATQTRERTLNRDRRVFVDVGYVPSGAHWNLKEGQIACDWPGVRGPRFILAVLTRYRAQPEVLGYGRYVLCVAVHASNATPQRIYLDLVFEQGSFANIETHGLLGDGIPGVSLTQRAGPPSKYERVLTHLGIGEVQRRESQRGMVVEE